MHFQIFSHIFSICVFSLTDDGSWVFYCSYFLSWMIHQDLINSYLDTTMLVTSFISFLKRIIGDEQVALLCTQNSPSNRPKMSEVVLMLEGNGLEERWAEWEKLEVIRNQEALSMPRLPPGWNLDSNSSFMQALELSGPR